MDRFDHLPHSSSREISSKSSRSRGIPMPYHIVQTAQAWTRYISDKADMLTIWTLNDEMSFRKAYVRFPTVVRLDRCQLFEGSKFCRRCCLFCFENLEGLIAVADGVASQPRRGEAVGPELV